MPPSPNALNLAVPPLFAPRSSDEAWGGAGDFDRRKFLKMFGMASAGAVIAVSSSKAELQDNEPSSKTAKLIGWPSGADDSNELFVYVYYYGIICTRRPDQEEHDAHGHYNGDTDYYINQKVRGHGVSPAMIVSETNAIPDTKVYTSQTISVETIVTVTYEDTVVIGDRPIYDGIDHKMFISDNCVVGVSENTKLYSEVCESLSALAQTKVPSNSMTYSPLNKEGYENLGSMQEGQTIARPIEIYTTERGWTVATAFKKDASGVRITGGTVTLQAQVPPLNGNIEVKADFVVDPADAGKAISKEFRWTHRLVRKRETFRFDPTTKKWSPYGTTSNPSSTNWILQPKQ